MNSGTTNSRKLAYDSNLYIMTHSGGGRETRRERKRGRVRERMERERECSFKSMGGDDHFDHLLKQESERGTL